MAAAAEMAEVAPSAEMTTRSNRTGCCCVGSRTESTRSSFMSAKFPRIHFMTKTICLSRQCSTLTSFFTCDDEIKKIVRLFIDKHMGF